jgi:chromosome segregation ATPase
MSPNSIGSGASTPTHHVAQPAPSMHPATTTSGQRQDEAPGGLSTESLRRMRNKKRAIVDQTPLVPTVSPTASSSRLETQLKAQQMEISQLKKERDDTISRLTKLEAYTARFDVLEDRVEQRKDDSEMIRPVVDRLAALEQLSLASELPRLRKGVEDLGPVLSRLDAVEKAQRATGLPSLRTNDARGNSTPQTQAADLKPLSDRVDRLEAASSKCVGDICNALDQAKKASNAVGEISDLKNDIATLQSWKGKLPTAMDEQAMKQLVFEEIFAKTDDTKTVLRNEVKAVEDRLAKRITADQKSILQLQTQVNTSLEFKTAMEQLNLSNLADRLTDLTGQVREVESNDIRICERCSKLEKEVGNLDEDRRKFDKDIDTLFDRCKDADTSLDRLRKDIDDYIGPIKEVYKNTEMTLMRRLGEIATSVGKIPQCQSELSKISSSQSAINWDLNKLSARLDELEKAASAPAAASGSGPVLEKVGKPVPSSPQTNDNFTNITTQRMGRLDKDVKDLRQALEETKGLTAKVEGLDARLVKSEDNTASYASERQTLSSRLATLDTRLSEKIQSLTTTLGSRLSNVETRVESVSGISETTTALENRLSDVESHMNILKDAGGSAQHPVNQSDPAVIIKDISTLREELGQLDTGLDEAEATIHQHTNDIAALQRSSVLLFEENFDPFKATVEEQLATINRNLEAYGVEVKELRQHGLRSRTRSSQSGFGDVERAQLKSIAEDTVNLKAIVDQLKSSLQAESTARVQELSGKADAQVTKNQLEACSYALNHLENRYENITTDDQYQRMAHWFGTTYPNAAALTNYAQIQQDVNQLKSFNRNVSWVQTLSQDLSNLVQVSPQLQSLATIASQLKTLVNSAPQLQQPVNKASQMQAFAASPSESPSTLAEIDKACTDVKTAVAKADQVEQEVGLQKKRIDDLRTAVSGLQTSFSNLNSSTSPFPKTETLGNLEKTIETLKTQLGNETQERQGTINGLRKTFGDAHEKRVEAEKQIKTSINELKEMKIDLEAMKKADLGLRVTKLAEQLSQTQASSSQLREDFDTMNNTLIEPNRDFFGLFGAMLTVVTQLQQIVESLNQNLPADPLKLDWEYYFPTLGQPKTNGGDTKGKGKGKSKQ